MADPRMQNKYKEPVSQNVDKYKEPVSQNVDKYIKPVSQNVDKYTECTTSINYPFFQSTSWRHQLQLVRRKFARVADRAFPRLTVVLTSAVYHFVFTGC